MLFIDEIEADDFKYRHFYCYYSSLVNNIDVLVTIEASDSLCLAAIVADREASHCLDRASNGIKLKNRKNIAEAFHLVHLVENKNEIKEKK